MIRVAIDINHVIRNIYGQILKYYNKDIDPSLDIEEIDTKEDIFKYLNFVTEDNKREFIYTDYPYEIFGCAKAVEKDLPAEINKWLYDITNFEKDAIDIFYFGLSEDSLTIQSSYFFLSKIGTRVRKVIFPTKDEEVITQADVIISTDGKLLSEAEGKYRILIKTKFNEEYHGKFENEFDSLSEVIKNKELLDVWYDKVHNTENIDAYGQE